MQPGSSRLCLCSRVSSPSIHKRCFNAITLTSGISGKFLLHGCSCFLYLTTSTSHPSKTTGGSFDNGSLTQTTREHPGQCHPGYTRPLQTHSRAGGVDTHAVCKEQTRSHR